MEENKIAEEILLSDTEIEITKIVENFIYFTLYNKKFGILFSEEDRTVEPVIFIVDEDFVFPHIMVSKFENEGKTYRRVCLNEQGSEVKYIQSFSDKITSSINILKKLLNLTKKQIEREYQGEFLYYWNIYADISIDVFINPERVFQNLNAYISKTVDDNDDANLAFRGVSKGIYLNDKNEFKHLPNMPIYYIPIIDNRGIIPPINDKLWSKEDILFILENDIVKKISSETYEKINSEKIKSEDTIMVFEMIINNQRITFAIMISMKLNKRLNFIDNLKVSNFKIELLKINRCDYHFLNEQIGNTNNALDKNVAIVGAGSLGSYLAEELVKSGIKNLTIYDDDKVDVANILRHKSNFKWRNISKTQCIKHKLEMIHPEIKITAKNMRITTNSLLECKDEYDLIIFAVGSSDIQLAVNKMLRENKHTKPVIFTWLEAGGEYSHILTVDYSKEGCFECLYTDNKGQYINNKANILSGIELEDNIIRLGCGATRVAYGTKVLLRTSSNLLDVINDIFSNHNFYCGLIDITSTKVIKQTDTYIERNCKCCGSSDKQ